MLKRLFLQGLLVIFTFCGHSQTVFKFNGVVKNSSNESIVGAITVTPFQDDMEGYNPKSAKKKKGRQEGLWGK